MIYALTIDFHNTLATCARWLELEVHTLGREALLWVGERAPQRCARNLLAGADAEAWLAEADVRYAEMRAQARDSGCEVSAIAAVTQILNDEFGMGVPADLIATAVEDLMRGGLAEVQPTAGLVEALAAVSAGRVLAVVSSAAYPQFVHWSLDKLGLAHHFAVVVTSAESGFYKTDPRIYETAVAQLQQLDPRITAARVAHMGDSLRFDVAGAQAAGLRTIWYNPDGKGAVGRNASVGTQPDVEIRQMSELAGALAQLG